MSLFKGVLGLPVEVNTLAAGARLAELDIKGIGRDQSIKILTKEFNFNFTRTQVDRLRSQDTYVSVKAEYEKTLVKSAVSRLRNDTAKLVPKIISAIEKGLDSGDIKAVAPALKILGVEVADPGTQQAQQIQVILPGKLERNVNESKS